MGEPIEAVRQGIKALLSELRGDPQALETAYLSVITFASQVRQTTKLTELMLFKEPRLEAEGCTLMGGALKLLAECVRTEVRKNTETQKGDWRPRPVGALAPASAMRCRSATEGSESGAKRLTLRRVSSMSRASMSEE